MITKIGENAVALNNPASNSGLTKKDVAEAGAGAFVAKKSLDHGLHRVFGLRGETHTTNKANAKSIRQAGNYLDPSKGGTGGSVGNADFVAGSKGHVHITGYNEAMKRDGHIPKGLIHGQPLYKKMQRALYGAASQGDIHGAMESAMMHGNSKPLRGLLRKGLTPGNAKTFHAMGSEDFYNKNFIPDMDDAALKTTKRLKVAPSKLRATMQGIRRYGLSGLKSSPIARPLIGAGVLAGGGYGAYKMMQPAANKLRRRLKR